MADLARGSLQSPPAGPNDNPKGYFVSTTASALGHFSVRRQIEWLNRSSSWWGLNKKDWEPKGVLGAGGNGVVGKWAYIGSERDKYPAYIAVKQSKPGSSDAANMLRESQLLERTTATGTEHIVKLYRGFHQDLGTGTAEKIDPVPYFNNPYGIPGNPPTHRDYLDICRIYLEYCADGDLYYGYLKKISARRNARPDSTTPEKILWRMFNCLARACLILEHGTEDPDVPDLTWGDKIVHFDIKPQNILIGNTDTNQHERLNPFKLTDFGLSLIIPPGTVLNTKEWKEATQWRATPGYMSPEMSFPDGYHPDRSIGTPTNIWSIGCCMHQVVCMIYPSVEVTFFHEVSPGKAIRVTAHPDEVLNTGLFPYSKDFINTLLHCLAYDPRQRKTAAELVRKTTQIVALYDAEDGPIYDDPLGKLTFPNTLPPGMQMQQFPQRNWQRNTNPRQQTWYGGGAPGAVKSRMAREATMRKTELLFDKDVPKKPAPPSFEDYPFQAMYPMPPIAAPPLVAKLPSDWPPAGVQAANRAGRTGSGLRGGTQSFQPRGGAPAFIPRQGQQPAAPQRGPGEGPQDAGSSRGPLAPTNTNWGGGVNAGRGRWIWRNGQRTWWAFIIIVIGGYLAFLTRISVVPQNEFEGLEW